MSYSRLDNSALLLSKMSASSAARLLEEIQDTMNLKEEELFWDHGALLDLPEPQGHMRSSIGSLGFDSDYHNMKQEPIESIPSVENLEGLSVYASAQIEMKEPSYASLRESSPEYGVKKKKGVC